MELRVAVVGSEAGWRIDVAVQRGSGGGGREPRSRRGRRSDACPRVRTGRVFAASALRGGARAALSADQSARDGVLRGPRRAAEAARDSAAQPVDRSGLHRGSDRGAAGRAAASSAAGTVGGIDRAASEPARAENQPAGREREHSALPIQPSNADIEPFAPKVRFPFPENESLFHPHLSKPFQRAQTPLQR